MYKSINVQTQETVHYKEELDMIQNETIVLSNAIFIFFMAKFLKPKSARRSTILVI